jgi:hypothetical protein
LKTASTEYRTADTEAFTFWTGDKRNGQAAKVDFESWVTAGNAPELLAAETERNNKAQVVNQLSVKLYGSDGSVLTQRQNACMTADNRLTYTKG